MPNPAFLAEEVDLESFLKDYDPAETPRYATSSGETVLMGALNNPDAAARVAIANRLLDDGADPAAVTKDGTTNTVHILLGVREGLTVDDAGVLARLLDGGADVNLPDDRRQAPLAILYNNYMIRDEDAGPLYDVLFARPDLDLDAPASTKITVRQLLDVYPDNKPDFQRRARSYQPQK